MKIKMKMKIFHMIILNYSSKDFLNKLNMYVLICGSISSIN